MKLANVVRQDVIEIGIETNSDELKKLLSELDNLRRSITNLGKSDSIDNITDDTKKLGEETRKSTKSLKDMANTNTSKLKSGLDKIKNSLDTIAKKAAGAAYQGLKKLAGISFKALTTGLAAAATGIGVLVSKAVSAYGDYEQLKGGVETLFKGNSDTVLKYANDAYKTAGLSANDYMETVTSFSASLIQSLGGDTKKAAEYSNIAITDMSDNANKMGTSMESLQYAYQGFAKQNYTMLDNLKLGYGGTKEEMKRLVKDAAKIDKSIDSNSLSYANIVKAIHAVQENMGITGTTAKEASETIQGSWSSLKASWGNLMTSLVTGGDSFDQCVDNLISSALTFKDNIMPAIEKALSGIGKLIEKLAPTLAEEFPKLVDELLPPLLKASTALLKGLIKSLPTIIKTLVKELPDIIKQIGEAIVEAFGGQSNFLGKFGEAFVKNAGTLAKAVPYILGLVGAFLAFKKVNSVVSVFSGLFGKSSGQGSGSGIGKGSGGIFSSLANLKPSIILKALGNVAIILGGLTILATFFMKVAPYLAQLSDFKSIIEVISVIAILGVVGSALTQLAGIVGKIPVSTVAKGLANIAIIIAGMSALFILIGAVSFLDFDYGKILKIIGIITLLGAVGSALAIFAGIVGLIPIPVVLAGLANIALVISGITAIIVAFGALSKISGFSDFVESGGNLLAKLFNAIGKIAGSLVGGLGEGISNSLPKIGENLTKFVEALKPMFTMFQGVDMSGAGAFFSALGGFMLKMAGEKLLSFFTGGTELGTLGTELTTFAEKASGFFTKVSGFPENGFTNATKLFQCLSGLGNLPGSGGIVQWFQGEVDYSKIATGLGQLSGEKVRKFFEFTSGIKAEAFDGATKLFDCLSGIGKLPNSGGVVQWFQGEVNYAKIATGLGNLSSDNIKKFFEFTSSLKAEAFDSAIKLFDCLNGIGKLPNSGGVVGWFQGEVDYAQIAEGLGHLSSDNVKKFFQMAESLSPKAFENTQTLFNTLAGIKDLPDDGGLFGWITGDDDTNDLLELGNSLGKFTEKASAFFKEVNGLNLSNLNGLWESLRKSEDITGDSLAKVGENISEIVKKVTKLPEQMGEGIKSAGQSLSDSLVSIWKEAAKAMANPVNKVIEGANWILKEFGSDKKIASWTPYAKGTDGHKGGNALVNDGRGAELVQMPNGNTFIPQGKNVFIPNAPKGMKVLPAEQTARLLGRKSPTFKYAKGTGNIDIWSYIDDAKGLVSAVTDKYVSYDGLSGYALSAGKGMVTTITDQMSSWAKKLFDEMGAKSLADYVASAGVEQWRSTVIRALKMEGQYSVANVERTLFQMQTESGGNPRAINLWDSNAKKGIPSKGLMQVIDPTFRAYARPGFNSNIYDPLSNILASIRYAVSRYGSLGRAYRGVGYANGGLITKPHVGLVGEAGDEMIIPLSSSKKERGLSLWAKAGEMLGVNLSSYTPESSDVTISSNRNSGTVESNTYAPVFNLTLNGTSDDRATARKVKQWINEALDDAFMNMGSKARV